MRQTNNVVFCQYCKLPAELVDGEIIYPNIPHLKHQPFWLCKRDNAYVGCKPNTTTPRAELANEEDRKKRQEWFRLKHPQRFAHNAAKLTRTKQP